MKPVDPTKGYELDTSFIQEQHHTNPRDYTVKLVQIGNIVLITKD